MHRDAVSNTIQYTRGHSSKIVKNGYCQLNSQHFFFRECVIGRRMVYNECH